MLVELAVTEQRYRAVLEVLEGASVVEVARRCGVARQTVHTWLRRYAAAGGMANLADRSSRPGTCPHQLPPAVESRVLALRLAHPGWGPDRIVFQLARDRDRGELAGRLPSQSAVYRRWRDTDCSTRPDAAVGGPTTGAGKGAGRWSCGRWT
jgi:hypothetical protein